jgi:hypothetical protein
MYGTPPQATADFSRFTLYYKLGMSLKIKLNMKQKKLTFIYVIFDTEKLVLLLLIFENFGR